eukprot:758761-Hanusia_phi.AAC.2
MSRDRLIARVRKELEHDGWSESRPTLAAPDSTSRTFLSSHLPPPPSQPHPNYTSRAYDSSDEHKAGWSAEATEGHCVSFPLTAQL